MEARSDQRARLSVPVSMFRAGRPEIVKRRTGNVSTGGLFISGGSWTHPENELQIIVDPDAGRPGNSSPLTCEIVRRMPGGFAVRFKFLGEAHKRMLDDLIFPKWDGANLLEGMMILVVREQVTDLAGWLRLTSILCGQYKRLCYAKRADSPG